MLKDSKKKTKKKVFSIPQVQRYLFFGLMFILPITVMPLPWDWTERIMSLLILIISILIVGLEIVKLIWNGKASILKSALDVGLFLILLSMLLSTMFSKDINSSLWGIDGRLGSSLIIFISILLVTITARGFIRDEKDIYKGFFLFLISLFLNNVLSLLSFLGLNIWGFIPLYQDLHQQGLPLLRSAKVHILLNTLGLIFSISFIGNYLISKKNETRYILSLMFGAFSIANIWMFSINQGINLVVLFSLLILFLGLFVLKKVRLQEKVSKNIFMYLIFTFAFLLLPVILLQIPEVRSLIIPDDFDIVSQVSLGTDISWRIASSTFVESLVRGLFGMGVDTYSIAYYLFKPLNINLVSFNNVTFYYAGSEVFTQFTNGGLFWLITWMFFGFLIIKTFIKDLKNIKLYADHEKSWLLLTVDLSILTIYLSSLFVSYSVLILFMFLTLISLRVVIKNVLRKGTTDKFVFKLWAANLNTSDSNQSIKSFNVFITIITAVISFLLVGFFGSKTLATVYALKAESFFVEQNAKYEGDVNPTIDEREAFVASMAHFYTKASEFDKGNPLYSRKRGLMYLERVGIAAEKYANSGEELGSDLVKDVGVWKNYLIDATRRSIDLSPSVYSNWESRSSVYTGLVGIGFYDYIADAIISLEKALELNPLNFEMYYNIAQIYVVNGEKDKALSSLTQVLSINPQHIPSIMLAGEINKERGNVDVYESYLKAAKKILETQGNTNSEIYTEVSKMLNAIASNESQEESSEEEVVVEEGSEEVVPDSVEQ